MSANLLRGPLCGFVARVPTVGTLLASGSAKNGVKLWSIPDGVQLDHVSPSLTIFSIAFSPAAPNLLAIGGNDGKKVPADGSAFQILKVDSASSKLIRVFNDMAPADVTVAGLRDVRGVAWSNAGTMVATVGKYSEIRLYR